MQSTLNSFGLYEQYCRFQTSCSELARAAVNRAMTVITDNAVVTVLSTSVLLLHASSADTSTFASPAENVKTASGDVDRTDAPARDVFVAYERLKSVWRASGETSAGASGKSYPARHGSKVNAGEEGRHKQHGHVHQQSNMGATDTLLVTALPTGYPSGRQSDEDFAKPSPQAKGDGGVSSAMREGEYGQDQDRNPKVKVRALTPPPAERQVSAIRLSKAAPLPLLVFDTETFATLGE